MSYIPCLEKNAVLFRSSIHCSHRIPNRPSSRQISILTYVNMSMPKIVRFGMRWERRLLNINKSTIFVAKDKKIIAPTPGLMRPELERLIGAAPEKLKNNNKWLKCLICVDKTKQKNKWKEEILLKDDDNFFWYFSFFLVLYNLYAIIFRRLDLNKFRWKSILYIIIELGVFLEREQRLLDKHMGFISKHSTTDSLLFYL